VGRLPVVAEDGSGRLVGILTRSDLLTAHERRLDERGRLADATLWG
jgi:CBS-domain-containing membrane protein